MPQLLSRIQTFAELSVVHKANLIWACVANTAIHKLADMLMVLDCMTDTMLGPEL